MRTIGNILWFIFGGLLGGLAWVFAGCIWCITIIGIPAGLQCFKFATPGILAAWKRNRVWKWHVFVSSKQHLSKAKSMPIKFLKASGKGFFIDKDGYALGIRDELADVIKVDAFKRQMKDIIEYRTMEYYRRRYVEK